MLRRTLTRILVATATVTAAPFALAQAPAAAPASTQKLVMIGTGSLVGIYNPAGGAVCRLVNRDRKVHGVRCSVDSTDGSGANIEALRDGTYEMAIVQSDVVWIAARGEGPYAQRGRFEDLRTVFALHPEPITVVARKEANIRRLRDLAGRRVFLGEPGSGTRQSLEAIMKLLEVQVSDAPLPDLKGGEDGAALCDGRIEAFVRIIGHPTDAVRLPAAICGARLVPVSGETVDRIIKARPYYAPAQIAGNLYPSNPQDTSSFGVRAVLVTTAKLPASDVYAMAKSVFDNFQELRKLHPALDGLNHTAMIGVDAIAPLHEGAARLYREKGWIKRP